VCLPSTQYLIPALVEEQDALYQKDRQQQKMLRRQSTRAGDAGISVQPRQQYRAPLPIGMVPRTPRASEGGCGGGEDEGSARRSRA
jgi:hypothetical protein